LKATHFLVYTFSKACLEQLSVAGMSFFGII